jgi:hypothetical protein
MNNYIKTAFVILLSAACTEMHSQIRTGYIFGLNLSTVTLKTKVGNSDPETPVGVHFGGFFEIPLAGKFTLQPALIFSAKGSNYKIDNVEHSISPAYIEVPAIVAFSFGSDDVKISLFAGPYFACGMGGYKIEPGGELKSIRFGTGNNSDLKLFDTGLNFGAGINIKSFLISAQYGFGLVNISPLTTDDQVMKNKVVGISISSSFAVN